MTKGEINRLGNMIRAEFDELSNSTLESLQDYRTSHKEILAEVFFYICKLSRNVTQQPIVTYRIKRIESIIGKLYRYPKMEFSRMWDVGGCRCILKTDDEVYALKNLIEKSQDLEIVKTYDYIENPQEEGYKSLHLFIRQKGKPITIELQIRNLIDHNWATLVEITDLLFDSKLKEYKKNKDLLRMHYLLSKRQNLDLSEYKEIAKILRKYAYLEKLTTVFSRNYIDVRKQWIEIENKHNHSYFLIETTKDKIPKITSYRNFEEAEIEYFNIYKSKINANVVLTHLPKVKYEHISIAYSNYILTFHSFFEDCNRIFEKLVESSLQSKSILGFYRYYKEYNDLAYLQIESFVKEVNELGNLGGNNNSKLNKKKKEWVADINLFVKKVSNRNKEFSRSFHANLPRSFIRKYLFSSCTKMLVKKNQNKIKNLLATTRYMR